MDMFDHKTLHHYYVLTSVSPLTVLVCLVYDTQQHAWNTCLTSEIAWLKSPFVYCVLSYAVQSFIVPHSWFCCGCRVRELMQTKDSFILPALWEMGMWRHARLMYLTQWKPRAEPMKTTFQGGQEPAWFMASLLDGVQYLDRSRGIENSSFNSPPLYAEQWSPAPDTPRSSLLSHCFIYSWLTRSRGSAPPFWGVEISSTGLYKWWQWLYRWTAGSWHWRVIKRINGLLIHTVRPKNVGIVWPI